MSSLLSLSALQQQFKTWRSSKTSSQQSVPDQLKEGIQGLRGEYFNRQLTKAVNSGNLRVALMLIKFKRWCSLCMRRREHTRDSLYSQY